MDEALWALGRGTGVVGLVLFSLAVVGGFTLFVLISAGLQTVLGGG